MNRCAFATLTVVIAVALPGCKTLSVNIIGSGTASSSPAGVNCSTDCSGRFSTGTTVAVDAQPDTNWSFTECVGCDSVIGQTGTVQMNVDRTVTVRFDPNGPISQIPGLPTALATIHVPRLPFPPLDPADLAGLPGLQASSRDLIVTLAPAATLTEVNRFLADVNGVVVGGEPLLDTLLIQIPPSPTLRSILDAWAKALTNPAFSASALNSPMEIERLPPHTGSGTAARWHWDLPAREPGNWGHKTLRVPQAWNLLDHARRKGHQPEVLILEDDGSGFDRNHPDLQSQFSRVVGTNGAIPDHGTLVAGIVGSLFDDRAGVEGIYPRSLGIHARLIDGILSLQQLIASELTANQAIRVINCSFGWTQDDLNPSPGVWGDPATIGLDYPSQPVQNDPSSPNFNPSFREYVRRTGDQLRAAMNVFAQRGRGDFIIICSAGNDNKGLPATSAYSAQDNSAIANLSVRFPGDQRYVSVESHDRLGNIAVDSNTGGTVSAPGVQVRNTESRVDDTATGARVNHDTFPVRPPHPEAWLDEPPTVDFAYGTQDGASFAAPHVAGLAVYLLSLDPGLSRQQLYQLLTRADTRVPIRGIRTASPRIDAFAAAMAIDLIRGDKKLQVALVDVDDGTRDGNMRSRLYPADPDDPDRIQTSDDRRGDGQVSMRDFRVWRDAYLLVNPITVGPGTVLDGPPTHFKRDINFDGCVVEGTTRAVVAPPHPNAAEEPVPSGASGAQPESRFPRYDFNGNGQVQWPIMHPFKMNPSGLTGADLSDRVRGVPGSVRDLDILADPDTWKVIEVDLYQEHVYVDPARELTGPGLPQYPPGPWWGKFRYLFGMRDHHTSAPPILKSLPDYVHSMDFHIEINWDALPPTTTRVLIGQDWPIQSEVWPDGTDNNGNTLVDEPYDETFERSIRRPRPTSGGREYLVVTIPIWTGNVRWNWNTEGGPPMLECRHPGRTFRFGEDFGITIPDDHSGNGGVCNH